MSNTFFYKSPLGGPL